MDFDQCKLGQVTSIPGAEWVGILVVGPLIGFENIALSQGQLRLKSLRYGQQFTVM